LAEKKHRLQQGRFLVEGVKLLEMALAAGARAREVFFCAEQLAGTTEPLLVALVAAGAEAMAVTPEVMAALAEREAAQGIVATFDLFETTLAALHPEEPALFVVLDRLQDPGNLGTLIRTADAAGATAVLLIEPSVDPFDPKVVRGSMGSLFTMPLVRTADVPALFDWLRRHGLRAVGADAHRGSVWGDELWPGSVALVLGNEARGLSPDVAAQIASWVKLPIVGKAESLNVAVAGGVLMYAWVRRNWQRNLIERQADAAHRLDLALEQDAELLAPIKAGKVHPAMTTFGLWQDDPEDVPDAHI
jgi:TrmH family RNA methyltransferase